MLRDHVRLIALLIPLALLVPAGLASQTIRGVLLEEGTDTPIVGATIEVLGPDSMVKTQVVSDRNGWFEAILSEAAEYRLRPSHLSYTATGLEAVGVGRNEIVTVVLRMGRTVIPLQPLVVTARTFDRLAGFYRRSETHKQGKFIHRPFIAARVASLPSQLLMVTPGVRVMRSADNTSYYFTMAGVGGPCIPNIYLDGLPVPHGLDITIDELTASDLIEGVEIYDSYTRAPDIFPVAMNQCGIVAFWSRREAHRRMTWKGAIIGVLAVAAFVLLAASQ